MTWALFLQVVALSALAFGAIVYWVRIQPAVNPERVTRQERNDRLDLFADRVEVMEDRLLVIEKTMPAYAEAMTDTLNRIEQRRRSVDQTERRIDTKRAEENGEMEPPQHLSILDRIRAGERR
jgi:hypothetical protein